MMKFATFENIVEQIYKHVMPKPKDQCSSFEQLGVSFVDRMLIEHVFIEYADGMAKLPVQQASRMLYRYSLPNESKKPRTLSKLSDRSAWERRMSKGKVAVQKMVLQWLSLLLNFRLNQHLINNRVRIEQGVVTSLLEENGIIKVVQYRNRKGEELLSAYAPLTIVCDGCFSNLRRSLCKPKIDVPSCFVGLVLENSSLPYANHGHVILGDPSPVLFYPITSTEVRCLIDVPGKKLPSVSNGELAKYLKTVVAPQIPPQIHDAFVAAVDKGNIKSMPNRSMPAAPLPTPGAFLMGDALNMRHPLTGGGMTVALSDIVVLRNLLRPLKDLNDAPKICRYLESFYTLRMPVASTINTLADALYRVFCASPDQARNEMRQACFEYLSLGWIFSSGPISLLSGLNPRPLSLALHFFAVAVYGVGRLLLPFPSPKRMWIGARLVYGASAIIFPIIKAEGVRKMFFPALVPAYYRPPPPQS